jgi:UDP-glucose:glycoprotein glucosyltransferase
MLAGSAQLGTEPRTAQETHQMVMDLFTDYDVPGIPSDTSLSLYKIALSMHVAVPRIEAAYSWYTNNIDEKTFGVEACGSWVEWRGKGFCVKEELRRDAEMSIEEGNDHDE